MNANIPVAILAQMKPQTLANLLEAHREIEEIRKRVYSGRPKKRVKRCGKCDKGDVTRKTKTANKDTTDKDTVDKDTTNNITPQVKQEDCPTDSDEAESVDYEEFNDDLFESDSDTTVRDSLSRGTEEGAQSDTEPDTPPDTLNEEAQNDTQLDTGTTNTQPDTTDTNSANKVRMSAEQFEPTEDPTLISRVQENVARDTSRASGHVATNEATSQVTSTQVTANLAASPVTATTPPPETHPYIAQNDYGLFVCGIDGCQLPYKSRGSVYRHWSRNHNVLAPRVCSFCPARFWALAQLAWHERQCREEQ
ncbi:hypothetical protein CJU90_1010 [Yarrowia sp. C11]|nr:hypothetical protein CKK34_2423 [Yarrowia sp. E02]KAG5373317.1 hypothetical protein CJU90_1010 [Yarrowia sp. C11]